ncbi:uncharacterized protein PHACADRAFT_102889 [Phanerochaete carnosa HHB-10118-sp]|uniref:Uncharacterized protein n=1 Tax=Phanerochaete carnosa (strain HHB-10118-sp) TaxID=650164 RepID=K5VVN1_PHACS|nr:uncharacterized protein PHACADRAFT_102889 [Phanerochaete carnosa HHB-10118-sp]EKM50840.1 hypothetical protein PHACADRAFT_102889 [Phanerochaete carnosa HHB-10118-sp]
MQEFHAASPLQSSSPYLMGMRAASSGSIFHESVWPPPNEGSRFVDPLVQGSSQVDLTRIVPDVMGPDQQTRTVIYGTPVVVGDGSVAQHGRPISQAGLLSYPSGPASPTATTATHQTTFTQQTTYTTQTAPSHHPMPSHSLRRSWERAQNQPINESLYDPNRDIDCGNAGSPVVEPQQMRLVIKNAEPLSPLSPTPVEPDQSFAQAQAKRESVISGSPRWLDRQIRKE